MPTMSTTTVPEWRPLPLRPTGPIARAEIEELERAFAAAAHGEDRAQLDIGDQGVPMITNGNPGSQNGNIDDGGARTPGS